MASLNVERSNSVIETSLTELAFIFFFILLTVSVWKISSSAEALTVAEIERQVLEDKVNELSESLSSVSEFMVVANQFDPDELFQELMAGRQATQELDKLHDLIGDDKSVSTLVDEFEKFNELTEELSKYDSYAGVDPVEVLEQLIQKNSDYKGQNINLRNKISEIGNGLDHPPCWADPETGGIQYVFDVVINETSVEFKKGWPESREGQAISNVNISTVPGVYPNNSELWNKTRALFLESEKMQCRHFVRIYDHAESKAAFKKYLLGVENHFYKFLSPRAYL